MNRLNYPVNPRNFFRSLTVSVVASAETLSGSASGQNVTQMNHCPLEEVGLFRV